jgi:hypothetical protein
MKNEDIAKLLADHCYNPQNNDFGFAVQLFVEKTVLPENLKSYNKKQMEEYILNYLKEK